MHDHDDCESLNAGKRFYSIDTLADVWKEALCESYDFDTEQHKDGDELP